MGSSTTTFTELLHDETVRRLSENQGQAPSVNRAIRVLFQQSKAGICLSWQIKPMILPRRPSTRGFSTMFIRINHCHENGSKPILSPEPPNQPKHQPRQRPHTHPPYRGWGWSKESPSPHERTVSLASHSPTIPACSPARSYGRLFQSSYS